MRCPTCGHDPMAEIQKQWAENYSRGMAQQQKMNQMSMGMGMMNAAAHQWSPNDAGRTFGNPACDEEPKPEPKPTAWEQFKTAIREVFP